jgi:hypothetical protein
MLYVEIGIDTLSEIHMDDRCVQMDFKNGTTIYLYGKAKSGPWLMKKLTEAFIREYEENAEEDAAADEQN